MMKNLRNALPLLALVGLVACGDATPTAPPEPTVAPTEASAAPANNTIGALTISNPWVRQALLPVEDPDMGGTDMMTNTEMMTDTGMMSDTDKMTDTNGMGNMGGMEMSGGTNSAAYMTITSSGGADRLIAASTDVAKKVELHTVTEVDGVMQMRPVEGGIEVPAGGSVELKPGGFHVMLLGITRDLMPGESITLELTFETAGTLTLTVPVQTAPSP